MKQKLYQNSKQGCDSFKSKASTGADNIPNYIRKPCPKYLASTLAKMFNRCLKTIYYCEVRKKALIILIHKGGSNIALAKCRSISTLNGFGRIFEAIIVEHLQFNLKQKFRGNQYGLRKVNLP